MNEYWTYICAGENDTGEKCTSGLEHPHAILANFNHIPCEWMPIFMSKKKAEEALRNRGFDISRIRKITMM